jgi:hypothetical protein
VGPAGAVGPDGSGGVHGGNTAPGHLLAVSSGNSGGGGGGGASGGHGQSGLRWNGGDGVAIAGTVVGSMRGGGGGARMRRFSPGTAEERRGRIRHRHHPLQTVRPVMYAATGRRHGHGGAGHRRHRRLGVVRLGGVWLPVTRWSVSAGRSWTARSPHPNPTSSRTRQATTSSCGCNHCRYPERTRPLAGPPRPNHGTAQSTHTQRPWRTQP